MAIKFILVFLAGAALGALGIQTFSGSDSAELVNSDIQKQKVELSDNISSAEDYAVLLRDNDALKAELQQLKRELSMSLRRPSVANQGPAVSEEASQAEIEALAAQEAVSERVMRAFQDPEYRKEMARIQVEPRLAELKTLLGLNEETFDQFKRVILDRVDRDTDIRLSWEELQREFYATESGGSEFQNSEVLTDQLSESWQQYLLELDQVLTAPQQEQLQAHREQQARTHREVMLAHQKVELTAQISDLSDYQKQTIEQLFSELKQLPVESGPAGQYFGDLPLMRSDSEFAIALQSATQQIIDLLSEEQVEQLKMTSFAYATEFQNE